MSKLPEPANAPLSPEKGSNGPSKPILYLAAGILVLSAIYFVPLRLLWSLAISSDLYSHVILIPAVSIYLVWDNRRQQRPAPSPSKPLLALVPLAVGALSLLVFFTSSFDLSDPDQLESYLAYSIFSYACFVIALCFLSFGTATLRQQIFPILFLVFIAPFPAELRIGIQTFLQHASAEVSFWFIQIAGIPVFREEGLVFHMPTISMEVAPECSGLRSSLVLFIVSTVGSYLFLKTQWKRSVFVMLVIPIGILRNAIRILVLAWQCYHTGPEMIDGWFHNHGGQPLFAVTLIPLFLTLWLFRRSERPSEARIVDR
ncbi:VPDSG-CTERM-specific exosortase XrtC [Pelagicoccus sp. SDUM812003]|uniref:VPDSG-CTERM-specific exosortase XrtC n=1 Tax=Pelagicoccus sp. SDUM812003 TaxID=3041267 RepID=UPI00280CD97F|nr:VPDSG-CTERM-specific exosortase XrtC [Pelagicoccus sp. SDUM812003]MDQ8205202.1 VPDSG-CTERM-specific exosortase XrtC [Pelagicoccus sp. SDUM812003]